MEFVADGEEENEAEEAVVEEDNGTPTPSAAVGRAAGGEKRRPLGWVWASSVEEKININ
jgi:hypothetical protein